MKNYTDITFLNIAEDKQYVSLIEKVVKQAFVEENLDKLPLYLTIILTDPEHIKKTNKQYRNIDKETDVLSFPMFEKQEIEMMITHGTPIEETLGDIMISIPRVEEQAKEYGHSFERELAYMVVHGFYHLMGYDHIEEQDQIQMRKKEETVLKLLNLDRE